MTAVLGLQRCALGVGELDAAVDFYADTWGLDVVSRDGEVAYLVSPASSAPWELRLRGAGQSRLDTLTLAVGDEDALALVLAAAERAEWPLVTGPARSEEPGGGITARMLDPDGRTIELLVGTDERHAATLPSGSSVPARLSHVVLNSPQPEVLVAAYGAVLGLRVSDYLEDKMYFLRATDVHHTIAIARAPHVSVNHVAFETLGVDEFMRATGRLVRGGHELLWGPGRHGPGNNTFAYFFDPNGFIAEFTTGLERISDPDRWEPRVWHSVPEESDLWGTANPRPGAAFVGIPDPGVGAPPPL